MIGVTRRLRALVTMGYPQTVLAGKLGLDDSTISALVGGRIPTVPAAVIADVVELYDRLSMIPGPSEQARNRAHRKGWMPPLAWDDETIDDDDAQPNPGHQEKIGFTERFLELRELGYRDLAIAERWKIQPASLLRQLNRYEIPPHHTLVSVVQESRYRQRSERAS